MSKLAWLTWQCPNGHGEFTEVDPKKIFQIIKTGEVFCPQCNAWFKKIDDVAYYEV